MTRFHRSLDDRRVFGVLGGVGEVLGVDPNLLRIATILLFFMTAGVPIVIAYLAAWVILPAGTPAQRLLRDREGSNAYARTL